MAGVKLGIVRLGRAAGKIKYTLLDERDISLVHEYSFEVVLWCVVPGSRLTLLHLLFDVTDFLLHVSPVLICPKCLLERHLGGVAPGFGVFHRNGVTMDNRLENLCLGQARPLAPRRGEAPCKQREHSLYWAAIQQLPPEHLVEELSDAAATKYFNANGEVIEEEEEGGCYYECHYPPCSSLEREPREFSICGRCQAARYCGLFCQQRDWPLHKRHCRPRAKAHRERAPER
ncbi:zinc finger protein, putative [Ixodes scapularis]|uniref:Zinc finger protein, putative n=1 Tax=Ixodes scapularis TaxID=6945 RepID=B7Q1D8_IXOSC|nr:zinc finger protein, putative [Ixodes scapularis]|eukprot:XP_002409468.1 zinc finger protein, putative [Ixodes scapularis]